MLCISFNALSTTNDLKDPVMIADGLWQVAAKHVNGLRALFVFE